MEYDYLLLLAVAVIWMVKLSCVPRRDTGDLPFQKAGRGCLWVLDPRSVDGSNPGSFQITPSLWVSDRVKTLRVPFKGRVSASFHSLDYQSHSSSTPDVLGTCLSSASLPDCAFQFVGLYHTTFLSLL